MEETHTLDALVQFIYHDMPAEEAYLTATIIGQNPELRASYADMLASKAQLPKALFNPSNEVLNRILQYSAKTSLDSCRF